MQGEEQSPWCCQGLGSHPGPTRGKQFLPSPCILLLLERGKTKRRLRGEPWWQWTETEEECWVPGSWRAPEHHRRPVCGGWRRHHSLCICSHTPVLLCGRWMWGLAFNALHSKSARSSKTSCLTKEPQQKLSHRCRKQTYGYQGRKEEERDKLRDWRWHIHTAMYQIGN